MDWRKPAKGVARREWQTRRRPRPEAQPHAWTNNG
jgi:hypothetical protein